MVTNLGTFFFFIKVLILKLLDMSQKSYAAGSDFPALETGKLRLYSMRFDPLAQRARLVLAAKNIP